MSESARSEIFAKLRTASRGGSAEAIDRERQSLQSAPAPMPPATEVCEAFLINVLKNRGTLQALTFAVNRLSRSSATGGA